MNLRQYAKGQPCMIRLPGCTGLNEETVLCHYRDSSTGMSNKENDLIGAWGCSHCHDLVDGRRYDHSIAGAEIKANFIEGIIRTQREILRAGLIKITRG